MQLAPLFPIIHSILKFAFPRCLWTGNVNSREIAITFDDGPHNRYTPQLLKVLDEYSIQASFFLLGCYVERYPEITQEICDRQHWIGLHGYQHKSFTEMKPQEFKQSLEDTQKAISKASNLEPTSIRDVRPPNGIFTPQTLQLLKQWEYRPVMWSVVPEDWVRPGVSTVVSRVIDQTVNGSIIVLHDGACAGEDVAASVAKIIPLLLDKGYNFVTIDRLWQQSTN